MAVNEIILARKAQVAVVQQILNNLKEFYLRLLTELDELQAGSGADAGNNAPQDTPSAQDLPEGEREGENQAPGKKGDR